MIIYRYLVANTPREVYDALMKDNKLRVKIGLNCGFESGGNGWIRDGCWPQYLDKEKQYRAPSMEYMLIPKYDLTEIQLAFHYDTVLTMAKDVYVERTDKRRKLFEKVLRKNLNDFKKLGMVTLQELIAIQIKQRSTQS